MLYKLKEKYWSWGDEFSIRDDKDHVIYKVYGKAFSWGNNLSFQDHLGKELALISQKLLTLKPCYRIIIDGKVIAQLIKEWSWFDKTFLLDVPGPNDYEIEGSFWSHEFIFRRSGRTVAKVSRNFESWTDAYGVYIEEGEDDIAVLCACIVIDQVISDENYG